MELNKLMMEVQKANRIIQMQSDYINAMPEPGELTDEQAKFQYILLYRALGNQFIVNQDIMNSLEDVADRLAEMAEEAEEDE